ncbi:MAG: hypothetical protein LUJ09_02500 [Firmicutes bacterium]|nr:hypothetical protein [Bacillota bacterium]
MGVVLFAMIMSVVLQGLYNSKLQAQEHYEKICSEIEVVCTVTNLTGTSADHLNLDSYQIFSFTGEMEGLETEIAPLVTDVQIKGEHRLMGALSEHSLVGITSLEIEQALWPENGCTIFWNDGFDASLFCGDQAACLIPEALAEEWQGDALRVSLPLEDAYAGLSFAPKDYTGELKIAGIYRGGDEKSIYCPWALLMEIWGEMGQREKASALHATLRNNSDISALRQAAADLFSVPDPNANPNDWGYALDIDDSQLAQADLTLRNSLRVHTFSVLLVFSLSIGAGFLIGFLLVRSRRREIALMRTMGTPDQSIYLGLVLEQMLCVVFGTAIGGATYLWQPPLQLAMFATAYFVGLTAALLVFLRKNLMTTIKEDDG